MNSQRDVTKLLRMRTIPAAIDYFKAQDPKTYINEWYLRGLVKSGVFPCHKAGKRILVNLDALEQYLLNPPVENNNLKDFRKIRRIKNT